MMYVKNYSLWYKIVQRNIIESVWSGNIKKWTERNSSTINVWSSSHLLLTNYLVFRTILIVNHQCNYYRSCFNSRNKFSRNRSKFTGWLWKTWHQRTTYTLWPELCIKKADECHIKMKNLNCDKCKKMVTWKKFVLIHWW